LDAASVIIIITKKHQTGHSGSTGRAYKRYTKHRISTNTWAGSTVPQANTRRFPTLTNTTKPQVHQTQSVGIRGGPKSKPLQNYQ